MSDDASRAAYFAAISKTISRELNTSTWILFVLTTIVFALRFYSRLTRNGFQLWADDWIMVAGYITVVATQIIVTYMISILTRPEKVVWARVHQNLQTIALGLTKTSFGVTLLRLMPEGWQHKLIILLLVTMNLQFLAHAFATWQKICLVPDRWTYPGDHCWTLDQNLTFSLFSALYSTFCDFVLALLPWRMIFNLQMKKSDRYGLAIALSMGSLAGIVGILKAVWAHKLMDARDPQGMLNQGRYWIWAMAEPYATIIAASVPVLRGFIRSARTGASNSGHGQGISDGYMKQQGSQTHNQSVVKSRRRNIGNTDNDSDISILGRVREENAIGNSPPAGIMWTQEISVQYESANGSQIPFSDQKVKSFDRSSEGDEYEMNQLAVNDKKSSNIKVAEMADHV